MSDWILEFDHVTYRYPLSTKPAIQDLSLRVPAGMRCAILGQNGCGKTTLFLLANGLYQPQKGKISFQGQPFQYDRPALMELRQHIGLVFQNPEHQVVASTVAEDLSYGLYNLGLPEVEIKARLERAIAQFDLTTLAHAPIHHLSLGQKKRVSIADVMVLNPMLLLLDEPTAYLDQHHTRSLVTTLKEIQAGGTTVLIATHDLDFVYRWADWVFVLNDGQLMLEGTPDTVFAQRQTLDALALGIPPTLELLEHMSDALQAGEGATSQLSLDQLQHLHQKAVQSLRWSTRTLGG